MTRRAGSPLRHAAGTGTYHPEVGRYGHGPAIDAAETVFAADSHAVALASRLLSPQVVNPLAPTAIGMVHIADGLHGNEQEATAWLLEHLAAKAAVSADRAARTSIVADRPPTA
jgi:thiopeptide-type bacteriocin biosynthesis protein